jgi:membrane-bound serine protease (ClpP class)
MVKVRRAVLVVAVLLLLVSVFVSNVRAQDNTVVVITIEGTVNPVLLDYVERGIEEAERAGAEALIIQIDTPGGLYDTTLEIIQSILSSRVPVVVYVAPAGARAASAGFYILQSGNIAAMATNTVTGAATPIQLGEEGEAEVSDELKAKILNDASAQIRELAREHGRNEEWAERAVREGVSATATEALDMNVIEIVAPTLENLVVQLDGRQITLMNDQVVTLHTRDAVIADTPMGTVERFLYTIADPNIAYILLSLAMLGIMAEIFNPGLIFPGIVGGICLLLAFFSLGVLPVNYAGILFIVLAFGLFIAEVLTTTFGLFTAGGVISLVIGSLILFQGAPPIFRVDPWLIATVTIVLAGAIAFILHRAIAAHRRQAGTGREELIGKVATVRIALNPEGTVYYRGERWNAVSESGEVKAGEQVVINRVDGLTLFVARKK